MLLYLFPFNILLCLLAVHVLAQYSVRNLSFSKGIPKGSLPWFYLQMKSKKETLKHEQFGPTLESVADCQVQNYFILLN